MKRFLIYLVALFCCGCNGKQENNNPYKRYVYTVNIEGHTYLLFSAYHAGGITHAEHCPCKTE